MKLLIVGTGVIGTLYGTMFRDGGHQVTHYVRVGKSLSLKEGIKIDVLDERKGFSKERQFTYFPETIEIINPGIQYDFVFITVNSYQLEEILKTLASKLLKSTFVILCMNWEGAELVDKFLDRKRYLIGYPGSGGTFKEGVLIASIGNDIRLGLIDGNDEGRFKVLQECFESVGITPAIKENILGWLQGHIALNVPLWLGVLFEGCVGLFLKDKKLLKLCFEATKECIELSKKRGVAIENNDETPSYRFPFWLFLIFLKVLYRTNKNMQRFTAHAAASGDEALFNAQKILSTARSIQFSMPNFEKLYQEISKKF